MNVMPSISGIIRSSKNQIGFLRIEGGVGFLAIGCPDGLEPLKFQKT